VAVTRQLIRCRDRSRAAQSSRPYLTGAISAPMWAAYQRCATIDGIPYISQANPDCFGEARSRAMKTLMKAEFRQISSKRRNFAWNFAFLPLHLSFCTDMIGSLSRC
jgi:hypothetical protein